jgi:hypothetical protein
MHLSDPLCPQQKKTSILEILQVTIHSACIETDRTNNSITTIRFT